MVKRYNKVSLLYLRYMEYRLYFPTNALLLRQNKKGGGNVNNLYEQLKERLSLIANMYDIIRIIDPISKSHMVIKNNQI